MRQSVRRGLYVFGVLVVLSAVIYLVGGVGESFTAYNYWPPKPMQTGNAAPDSTPVSENVQMATDIGRDARRMAPGSIEEFNNYGNPTDLTVKSRHLEWLKNQPQTDYYRQAGRYDKWGESMDVDKMPAVIGRMTRNAESGLGDKLALSMFESNPAPLQVGAVVIPRATTVVNAMSE